MNDDLLKLAEQLGAPGILVLGDLMLDRYTWGDAERVSPEAPVLVLEVDGQEVRLGGAASVAFLARGLDARVAAAGVVGDDADGRMLRRLLDKDSIDHQFVLDDPLRPTTVKERFVGRAGSGQPHQILRVDHEERRPLSAESERLLATRIVARLDEYQAVLVSDYNKGVCTPRLLGCVIGQAAKVGIPVIVDPARISDYGRYTGANVLTPNRAEAELATGREITTRNAALVAGCDLCSQCRSEAVLVTLDSEGLALVRHDGSGELVATRPCSVYDVTGAGDVVLAMVGLCQAANVPLAETARLANVAAGLEVQRLGVAPVSRAEIETELVGTKRRGAGKLTSLDAMTELAESYRRAGKTIVFTNGCFDLLHVGHATYLEQAARLGDVLVVAANSDQSARRLKGPNRPLINQHDRAALLASLASVDHVLIFDEDTPHKLLRRIRPNVLVKGGTYTPDAVVGHEVVEAYGGEVRVTGRVAGVSTSEILASVHSHETSSQAKAQENPQGGQFSLLKADHPLQ